MPELPEVETVVKALDGVLKGRLVRGAGFIGKLRLPFDERDAAGRLAGRRVIGVRRRAKYILVDLEGQRALLAHLGMTGCFRVEPADSPRHRHDRVYFPLDRGEELRYADARRFGFVKPVTLSGPGGLPEELAGLGPEPLDRRFTGRVLMERAAGRRSPVKIFIMDQAVVVGVGNIYASEALFLAGVHPKRPASDLSPEEWIRLVAKIKAVLRDAIRQGGSTIRSYRTVDGSEGGFQQALRVYGRAGQPCPVCGSPVEALRLGGRSTFFCPECQGE